MTDEIEQANRALTYYYGGDPGGWDSSQLLRPVGSFHHKAQQPVIEIFRSVGERYPLSMFSIIPEPPDLVDTMDLKMAPFDMGSLSDRITPLYEHGPEHGDRSKGLMNLGFMLAEDGLSPDEALSVMHRADDTWGKFGGREDQMQRLREILTIAYSKYPKLVLDVIAEVDNIYPMSPFGKISLTIPDVEWVLEGLHVENSLMLLTGPPNVGKSLMALNMAIKAARGESWLNWKFNRPYRVGFFSFEMGQAQLAPALAKMLEGATDTEEVQERMMAFPLGYPIDLSATVDQVRFRNTIKKYNIECLIIDSLSTASAESLQDEQVKSIMGLFARLQDEFKLFTVMLHHDRKTAAGDKKKSGLDEVYGSTFIAANASTIASLLAKSMDVVELSFPKVRMAANPGSSLWKRDSNLWYRSMNTAAKITTKDPNLNLKPGSGTLDLS